MCIHDRVRMHIGSLSMRCILEFETSRIYPWTEHVDYEAAL
jgi:hypothetical protein